jgi:hypothetical protein
MELGVPGVLALSARVFTKCLRRVCPVPNLKLTYDLPDRVPRFALFAGNTNATADLMGRFPGLLEQEVRTPFRDGGIWLVRPGGYLACSSSDTEAVANYLDRLVRARTD